MKLALLVVATLVMQRVLGLPGLPAWAVELQLPVVWVVGPAMLRHDAHWVPLAILLGLAADAVTGQPVIGPGGIAWSAAAVCLTGLASVIADRSPKAWAVFGAAGALLTVVGVQLALWPLGLAHMPTTGYLLRTALLTGAWCGLVGLVLHLDLPERLERHRARRLR